MAQKDWDRANKMLHKLDSAKNNTKKNNSKLIILTANMNVQIKDHRREAESLRIKDMEGLSTYLLHKNIGLLRLHV